MLVSQSYRIILRRLSANKGNISSLSSRCSVRSQSTTTSTSLTSIEYNADTNHYKESLFDFPVEKKELSTNAFEKVGEAPNADFEALLGAYNDLETKFQEPVAVGLEMNMDDAIIAQDKEKTFDKILVLVSSSEGMNVPFEKKWDQAGFPSGEAQFHEEYPSDPFLSPKGIGQAMDCARETAKHFNQENGLVPELFVVNPLRRATMTTFLAFPQHVPRMLHEKPWICHPQCQEEANGKSSDFVCEVDILKENFGGIDYTLYEETYDVEKMNSFDKRPLIESKKDLLRRTNYFLNWLNDREERVIAVGSSSAWFQSLCGFTIDCINQSNKFDTFPEGELRVIGIKYRR